MKKVKFSLWYLPAALLLVLLAQSIFIAPRPVSVSYSTMLQLADENKIERALITSDQIRFQLRPGTPLEGDLANQVQKSRGMMSGLAPDQVITFEATRPPGLELSS